MINRLVAFAGIVALFGFVASTKADEPSKNKNAINEAAEESPLFGRIIDETGKPVTDAQLTLNGPEYLKAKADQNGQYAFLAVKKPGVYRLRVVSRRWIGFSEYSEQIEIALDPGRNLQKDFTLQRACQINAKVADENGKPLVATLFSNAVATEDSNGMHETRTNIGGKATINGIKRSKSKYIVVARAKGYAPARAYVSVDPDKVGECTIVLKAGKTIRGKVMCKDGNPAVGWTIIARPSWQKNAPRPSSAKIGEDGSFELHDVGIEKQNVSIKIPVSKHSWTTRTVMDGAVLDESEPINATVNYPSPASMDYLTCKIRWIGKPVRSFGISGYCQDLDHHISDFVESGPKEFKLGPMPKGMYRIRIDGSTIECMNLRGIKNLDTLDQVKVPNEKPLQIVLREKGKPHLQGKVIDSMTKKPIKSFHYRVTKVRTLSGPNYVTGDEWNLVSNEKGEFFVDVSGPGIYYTRILADGYAMKQSVEVNTDESPDKVVEVALEKGISVRGKVIDVAGKRVANAKVRAVSLAGGSYGNAIREFVTDMRAIQTDANGEFQFDHLSVGYDTIRVDHKDYVYARTSVRVKKDVDPLTIRLKTGATIQGTVYDHLGQPAANEPIYFHKDDNFIGGDKKPGLFARTTTDDKGHFRVSRLPQTFVHLSRDNPWQASGVMRHAVKTRDGETHEVDMGGVDKITGRLLVNDAPLGNTRIKLTGDDSTFGKMVMYGVTATDGSFVLYGAPPGNWVLNRALIGSRGDWVKVRDVDVPAKGNVELGALNSLAGTLAVNFKTPNESKLPSKLRVELQQHSEIHDLGRKAAKLVARGDTTDPYVFESVVPGDYDLEVNYGKFEIRKRIRVEPNDLGKSIDCVVPSGNAKVQLTLLDAKNNPSGSTVCLWSADGMVKSVMQRKDNADGKPFHEVAELADGKYVVRSYFQRTGDSYCEIEVVDGKDVIKEVKLPEKWNSPDVNLMFNIFDDQGAIVRGRVEVVSDQPIRSGQGDYGNGTKLVIPKGSTFIAKINISGFKPFEQELQEVTKPKNIDVRLERNE